MAADSELHKKALAALAVARVRASRQQPYTTAALYRLRPVAAPGLGTLAVDPGWRLYFDPEVVANVWSSRELAGGLLHEVWHLLRCHSSRCGARDRKLWNIAGDCEINDDLPPHDAPPTTSATLAQTDILPATFKLPDGQTAEVYFDALLQKSPPPPKGRGGKCGSGAGGEPAPGEKAAQAAAAAAGALPAPVTPQEAAITIRQVAEGVKAALQAAKGRGDVPAGLARWADVALGRPKIPFARLIRAALDGAVAYVRGQAEPTYTRPARRDVPGFILAGRHRPLPEWAIVIDTSGSVSEKELALALRETAAALRALPKAGVTVISCDSAVGAAKRAFDLRSLRSAIVGGGGTDMSVGLAAAAKLQPRPSLTVVLTDGDTPWPAEPPRCGRVIVGLLNASDSAVAAVPKWATVVRIED